MQFTHFYLKGGLIARTAEAITTNIYGTLFELPHLEPIHVQSQLNKVPPRFSEWDQGMHLYRQIQHAHLVEICWIPF